jgi:hypothetical protein
VLDVSAGVGRCCVDGASMFGRPLRQMQVASVCPSISTESAPQDPSPVGVQGRGRRLSRR